MNTSANNLDQWKMTFETDRLVQGFLEQLFSTQKDMEKAFQGGLAEYLSNKETLDEIEVFNERFFRMLHQKSTRYLGALMSGVRKRELRLDAEKCLDMESQND